jgi:hypothetical protein
LRVLRIDPATGETELIGDDLGGNSNSIFGGIMAAADGKLLLMVGGRMSGCALRIDPATGETELIGDKLGDKRGDKASFPLVALPDGQLLCTGGHWPWTVVRRMDLTTNEIKDIGAYRTSRVASYNWSGCAAAADGTLYFAPEEATRVLRIKVGLISDEADAERVLPFFKLCDLKVAAEAAEAAQVRALDPPSRELFETLQKWREEQAEATGVKAGKILPSGVLVRIAAARPTSIEQLRAVKGMGAVRSQRHGGAIVRLAALPPAAQSEEARRDDGDTAAGHIGEATFTPERGSMYPTAPVEAAFGLSATGV